MYVNTQEFIDDVKNTSSYIGAATLVVIGSDEDRKDILKYIDKQRTELGDRVDIQESDTIFMDCISKDATHLIICDRDIEKAIDRINEMIQVFKIDELENIQLVDVPYATDMNFLFSIKSNEILFISKFQT